MKAKFQDRNFFVMKSFIASICLRTFICNRSFGVIEDEDKSVLFTQLHYTRLQILVKCSAELIWEKIYEFWKNSTLHELDLRSYSLKPNNLIYDENYKKINLTEKTG